MTSSVEKTGGMGQELSNVHNRVLGRPAWLSVSVDQKFKFQSQLSIVATRALYERGTVLQRLLDGLIEERF